MSQDKPPFRIEDNILIGEELPNERSNLGEAILEKLKSQPKFMAQIEWDTGKFNTFEEVLEKSVKCAIWMKRQGIKPGDILGICLHNCRDVPVPVFASLYLTAIISTWDHDLTTRSARYYAELVSPKLVFITAASAGKLREATRDLGKDVKIVTVGKAEGFESLDDILATVDDAEVRSFKCTPVKDPGDTALICYSSGTTGLPKGTELSHRSLYYSCTPTEEGMVAGEIAIWMPTVRWTVGLTLLVEAFLTEARVIIMPETENDLFCFELIDKYGVTYFGTDPSVPLRWLKLGYQDQYPLRSLRKMVSIGSSINSAKQQALAKAYPHAQLLQTYGLTDAGGMVTCQTKNSKPGSSGYVCRGRTMKIVDTKTGAALGPNQIGEAYIKSPYIMTGYYNNPESTAKVFTEDGWLKTNDMMHYDEDGEIFFAGRCSEFINYRSIKLCAGEIECVLESHPSVMKAAVVPVPHEIEEEHPMAFITKVPGKEVAVEELMKLVDDSLPWYCMLRAGIKFLAAMPLTATGKIARNELKDMARRISIPASD